MGYPEALRLVIKFAEAGRKYKISLFPRLQQVLAYLRVHYEPLRTFFQEECRAEDAEDALKLILAEAERAESGGDTGDTGHSADAPGSAGGESAEEAGTL